MLIDDSGKQYFVTEIFYSHKNFDAVTKLLQMYMADTTSTLSGVNTNGFCKLKAYTREELNNIVMKISELEGITY